MSNDKQSVKRLFKSKKTLSPKVQGF